jgi:hypothetical protein
MLGHITRMSRLKPFVILDVIVTLPLFAYATYTTFKRPPIDTFWFELVLLAFALIVMFPSMVCLAGRSLHQVVAAICLFLYVGFLILMCFRLLSGWHDPYYATLIRIGMMLLVAKSIYGVISVTKRHA